MSAQGRHSQINTIFSNFQIQRVTGGGLMYFYATIAEDFSVIIHMFNRKRNNYELYMMSEWRMIRDSNELTK